MKLVGELAESVSKAKNQQEARELIWIAGMELSDEETAQVVGGATVPPVTEETRDNYTCKNQHRFGPREAQFYQYICPYCQGKLFTGVNY